MDTLASRLRAARGTATQATWATMIGVTQGCVSRWEHGEMPDAAALGRLAEHAHLCLACLVIGPHHRRARHANGRQDLTPPR